MSEQTMPEWAERLIAAHLQVTDQVSHNERLQAERYFVWQEERQNALKSDNRQQNCAVCGSTDLFTKQEFDPWAAELERALDDAGICWEFNSVQYEPETSLYHYEWLWEII